MLKSIYVVLARNFSRKILPTVLGIAICTAYLAGVLCVLEGFKESTYTFVARFEQPNFLVYRGSTLSESFIRASELADVRGAFCRLLEVNVSGVRTRALSIEDTHNVLDYSYEGLWLGKELGGLAKRGDCVVLTYAARNITANVSGIYTSALFPEDWVLAPATLLVHLEPRFAANYSFVICENTEAAKIADTKKQPMVCVVNFFERSVEDLASLLWLLILFSGAVVLLLVYNRTVLELRYSEKDVQTLRRIGAAPRVVFSVLLLRTLFFAALGGLLGIALGIVLAHGVLSLGTLFKLESGMAPVVAVHTLLLPFLLALASALLGALFPILKYAYCEIEKHKERL